jgi:predicted dienelactone hydrolase
VRPFEFAFLLGLACVLVGFCVPAARRPAWARWLCGIAILALLLHLVIEGPRWQLRVVYGLAGVVAVAAIVGALRKVPERTIVWRHALIVVATLFGASGLLYSTALAVGLPMFELPEPTGPHAVGVTSLYVADASRPETWTADPDDHRELMVEIWYPAEPAPGAEPAPYWDDAALVGPHQAQLSRDMLGLIVSDDGSSHYGDVPTHSHRDAPVVAAPQKFPVLVFSHGYGIGRPQTYTALMEELASHGYFVASIAHTYETPAVVFEDGRVVPFDPIAVSAILQREDDDGDRVFEDFSNSQDPEERDQIMREYLATQEAAARSMSVWDADTRTVVDELERVVSGERETPFAGRLDLERLGIVGMSFGGAAAAYFCVEDARCKAGLNLDGLHYGRGMADAVVKVPFMIVYAKRPGVPMNEFYYRHATGPAFQVTIADTTHMNFTDVSISAPLLRWVGALGAIDGQRMLRLMNVYTLAFFDRYLRDEPSALLEASSPHYPEVTIEHRNTGS